MSARAAAQPTPIAPVAAGVPAQTRETIADLLERYGHILDDGRVDAWSALFEHDALYQVTTRENVDAQRPIGIVLCRGRAMMDDRIQALKLANIFESHAHRHLLGRPLIEADGADRYRVRSSFVVHRIMYIGQTDVFATGRYDDVIVVESGDARFAERRVILDSRLIDTLMVYPL